MKTVIVHRIEMPPAPSTFGTFNFTPKTLVPWLMRHVPERVGPYLFEQFDRGYRPTMPWNETSA